MTDEQLAEIEARCEAATPGPWARKRGQFTRVVSFSDENGTVVASTYTSSFAPPKIQAMENASFIAHARTDVPALLAEVKRLRRWQKEAAEYFRNASLEEHAGPEGTPQCQCGSCLKVLALLADVRE